MRSPTTDICRQAAGHCGLPTENMHAQMGLCITGYGATSMSHARFNTYINTTSAQLHGAGWSHTIRCTPHVMTAGSKEAACILELSELHITHDTAWRTTVLCTETCMLCGRVRPQSNTCHSTHETKNRVIMASVATSYRGLRFLGPTAQQGRHTTAPTPHHPDRLKKCTQPRLLNSNQFGIG
jgi:hypothetical protein